MSGELRCRLQYDCTGLFELVHYTSEFALN